MVGYTKRAQYAIVIANLEAQENRQSVVEADNFLMSLLFQYTSTALKILKSLSFDRDAVSLAMKQELFRSRKNRNRELNLSEDVVEPNNHAFLGQAWEEARLAGHNALGTEHLLLAILNSDGYARRILNEHGITTEIVRAILRKIESGDIPDGLTNA